MLCVCMCVLVYLVSEEGGELEGGNGDGLNVCTKKVSSTTLPQRETDG